MPEPESQEMTDEQAGQLEQDYLEGKFTESGPVVEKEVEEEEEKEPSEEGPAIKENQRLRQKNREVNEQMESLQQQLEALSARVTESSAPAKEEQTQIQKASTEDLLRAETQIETKLYQAIADGDDEAKGRLTEAKASIRAELMERPAMKMAKVKDEEEAKFQWTALENAVLEAVPDIKDKSSDIYKAAQKWAENNKALMKAYGSHLGGVLATAQALILSKSTPKSSKQAIKSVTQEMEKIAESSVSRSGSSASQKGKTEANYKFMSDEDFEKNYQEMLMGERPIP